MSYSNRSKSQSLLHFWKFFRLAIQYPDSMKIWHAKTHSYVSRSSNMRDLWRNVLWNKTLCVVLFHAKLRWRSQIRSVPSVLVIRTQLNWFKHLRLFSPRWISFNSSVSSEEHSPSKHEEHWAGSNRRPTDRSKRQLLASRKLRRMQPSYHGTIPRYNADMPPWNKGTHEGIWCYGVAILCWNGIMARTYHGVVAPWDHGVIVILDHLLTCIPRCLSDPVIVCLPATCKMQGSWRKPLR